MIHSPGRVIVRSVSTAGCHPGAFRGFHLFLVLEERVRSAVAAHVEKHYAVDVAIVVEQPPKPEFGELAIPVGFALAKSLKRSPRDIVEEISASIEHIPGVTSIEPSGTGYINVRLDRAAYAESISAPPQKTVPNDGKIIVEHTNINPNKAAHIGHLRNAILGDTLVRMLRALGCEVEVQNYIDNTGVQVADVVAAFHYLEQKTPKQVQLLVNSTDVKFDYYCWDIYARISQIFEEDASTRGWRSETLHAIEIGEGTQADIGRIVSDAMVSKHLGTMRRIGVHYDVLPRESEILHLKFWSSAFDLLKKKSAIYLETRGKNSGCWVMPGELFREQVVASKADPPDGDKSSETSDNKRESAKVIVRSNGTVTYVGKDIAYQLWKFGLLDKDFQYQPFSTDPQGRTTWMSSVDATDREQPQFGAGEKVYNVIDVRQSYLQDVVNGGLRALGFEQEAKNSIHFSYEMVALSPRCCAELGIKLSEEDQRRPHVEVSGRKGLGVKADDLIDLLIENALEEVRVRHGESGETTQRKIATDIAVGALRYFMLKFTRTSVIAFDFQEALSFEGETGPYIQYAAVRARNILCKLKDRGEPLPNFGKELDLAVFRRQLAVEDFWQMLLGASKRESTIAKSVTAGEPAQLARFGFQLAQAFNNFYHRHHILNEKDTERRVFLLWMTQFFLQELEQVLDTMGIPAPEVM